LPVADGVVAVQAVGIGLGIDILVVDNMLPFKIPIDDFGAPTEIKVTVDTPVENPCCCCSPRWLPVKVKPPAGLIFFHTLSPPLQFYAYAGISVALFTGPVIACIA
jgi:hypothetical protein